MDTCEYYGYFFYGCLECWDGVCVLIDIFILKSFVPLYLDFRNLDIHTVSWYHVRRELNKEADRLANETMNREKI